MLNQLQGVFASFHSHNVRYVIIGGIAAILYGVPLTTTEELLAHEITIFQDKVRIDVQTSTPGIDFGHAWAEREEMSYAGEVFYLVSRRHLIASKRAAGREQDLEDVKLLELGDKE